jgi:N-acetylglucosamine-6-phosphate deacetylase
VLVAVTMAPEVPGGADAITAFAAAGVLVSLGHCDATGAEASAAFDLGASALTHGLNAHRPLAAREPGPLGVALTRHDVVVTAIADGVHLDPINLALLHQAAPGRIALVTDGIVAAGLGDGTYRYGPLEVTVADGRATLGSGRLAGSVATMDSSVRTAAAQWGVEQALAAATSVPATLIGRPELGRIAVGQRADIAILDNQLTVGRTLCAGQVVFEAPR